MTEKRKHCNDIFDLGYQGGNVHAENLCNRLQFRKKEKIQLARGYCAKLKYGKV
jgi:hypothetical protein